MGSMKDLIGDDLFDRKSYPERPGYTEPTTSRDAARQVSSRASDLRARVLKMISDAPLGLTADECASLIGESEITTRPRVTELAKLGKIEKTGERRRNANGGMAAVWRSKKEAASS